MTAQVSLSMLIALVVCSCDQPSDTLYDGFEEVERFDVQDPYPEASEVRLIVQTGWSEQNGNAVFGDPDGTTLDELQRVRFEQALTIETRIADMHACFIPHHFFRYFDNAGEQIGEVAVCFCCYGVQASGSEQLTAPEGFLLSADYSELRNLVEDLGEPTDVLCD